MPKAYWIGRVDVHNEEGYKPYAAANPAIFRKYGGRFVVRAGKFECVEGGSRSRNVVIEFPDYQSAVACYRSPEYQANIKVRQPHAIADLDHCRRLRRPAAVNLSFPASGGGAAPWRGGRGKYGASHHLPLPARSARHLPRERGRMKAASRCSPRPLPLYPRRTEKVLMAAENSDMRLVIAGAGGRMGRTLIQRHRGDQGRHPCWRGRGGGFGRDRPRCR